MACKGAKYLKNRIVAKLVTENRQPCIFCQQDVDDEVIYGKLYALGDIQCHYFCVLLSCCLVQKGKDTEGLFGFLYKDILAEVERSKKHKCSYCGRGGANLGCSISACRKQFHLPCGRQKNAVSLFFGNYKSFCELHAPKQKISDSVMANAKERLKKEKLIKAGKIPISNGEDNKQTESPEDPAMVCVICYEEVRGYPTTQTFWPPCCGRDAWLHRTCLQRMALSAGLHYLKCPLCNDKDTFYEAVSDQGYYLPDRDAAWELEQNAFAEIYSHDLSCAAEDCKCPFGRSHDELGMWDIKLCVLCGSWGMHVQCLAGARALCGACRPAARGLDQLEARLAAVIVAEQARQQQNSRSGPVMPSRMSLRRTKGRVQPHSSTSTSQNLPMEETRPRKTEPQSPIKADRLELNLKTPRRLKLLTPNLKDLETKLLSPIKMLEQSYLEKGGGGDVVVTSEVIEKIRLKFSKPKPLSAKKKIVNEILDDLFKNVFKENVKSKVPVKEWNSPKKSFDFTNATCEESKENAEQIITTNTFETKERKVDIDPEKDVAIVTDVDASATSEISNTFDEQCDEENGQATTCNNTALVEEESNIFSEEAGDKEKHLDNDSNANLNVNDTAIVKDNETLKNDDESSNSTLLPPEFIAESKDNLPIFDTPKKRKTVDMNQDSSIEISENDEMVNINVVQIGSGKEKEFIKNLTIKSPVKNKTCSFKFSPADKETLQTSNVDIDVESFKDHYLNEVDRDFRINVHQLKSDDEVILSTVADSAEGSMSRKRKLEMKEEVSKKRKKNKLKLKIKNGGDPESTKERKRVKKLKRKPKGSMGVLKLKKITEDDKKAKDKKRAKKLINMRELQKELGRAKHTSVKIKLKDRSKIKTKKCKKKQKEKSYKQYILKYATVQFSKVIAKPEADISPIKRKYTKQEKPSDNLVQTSIQSFFKAK